MKKLLIGLSLLASMSSLASNGNSFQFEPGEYSGVTDDGKDCSLIISDDVKVESSIKYNLILEKGRKSYGDFSVLKLNYAIKNTAQETGLYFSRQVDMMFGGYYNDDLSLIFGDNGNIERVEFLKEARIFGSDTIINCNLDEEIGYSILDL
ncbi:MAG: hypothetical protein ACJAS4_002649 [Bacteriovoracaceae bacterium]|jgi:hypothetical protein